MTSLCSDASSSVSSRRRQPHDETAWDRMNEEFQKRRDKGSAFSTSPWEREEKEKLQREQLLDARRVRDQEIAYLESTEERTEKQEEWLRILRLEREFQRRAEQELRDDDDDEASLCSEDSDTDTQQPENFLGDKLTVISNERHGQKLVDELENSSKNSTSSEKSKQDREIPSKSPSEKHFIPLELTIPDRDLHQLPSMLGNNILQVSTEHNLDSSGNRHSKPPIPAPRPSKTYGTIQPFLLTKFDAGINDQENNSEHIADTAHSGGSDSRITNTNVSSLTKLEISDSSAFFCATENGSDRGRDLQQDNWLIEVNSFEPNAVNDRDDSRGLAHFIKQNGEQKEESRIYENIKPIEYQNSKQLAANSSKNAFGSHTLPKSTNSNIILSTSKELFGSKGSISHTEKRFPAMGISSTLSKKLNGVTLSDIDILPTLYASSKTKNGYTKDVPSDLADKSPEFKKLWISRPEKLTFQDKIRKFSLQAGEEDVPRDRVKNSRAQREIENKFNEAQRKTSSTSEP